MKARIKGFDDPFREVETLTMRGVNGTYFAEDVEFEQEPQGKSALDTTNEEKVELKYKDGDWIVYDNNVYKICNIGLGISYECLGVDNTVHVYNHLIDNKSHLWSIEDAKDGDVLACNEELLLFKSYSAQNKRISLYCWYNGHTGNFHEKEVVDILLTTRNKVYPASKERRDLLFQKMGQAGYEWDAEQKELKKIEDEPENYKKQLMSEMADLVVDYIQQKPTWKPTEKQIDAIRLARSFVTDDFSDNPTLSETLLELENQLKKIMEE